MILRVERIPCWMHAWAYARAVALRSAGRQARERKRFVPSRYASIPELADPLSGTDQVDIDLRDTLDDVLVKLDQNERKLVAAIVGAKTLEESAATLRVSVRTVKRRRRALHEKIVRALRGPS